MKRLIVLLGIFLSTQALCTNKLNPEPGFYGDFGLEAYHYYYRETENAEFFMSHQGPLYGFYCLLGYQPEFTLFRGALDLEMAWGNKILYKSNGTGKKDNDRYNRTELRLLGFYPWHFENQWALEGYTGWGKRFLNKAPGLGTTTTGHYGYYRSSNYSYVPIGVRIIKAFKNDVEWVGFLEFDWFLCGIQRSGRNWVNPQNKGVGYRAGLDCYIPGESCDYMIGVFARFWNIDISEKRLSADQKWTYWEPQNKTNEVGVRIGFSF